METTLFIAQILAVALFVLGASVFFNSRYYSKVYGDIMKNTALLFVTSLVILVVSTVIILVHNVWEWQWYVLITIVGWGGLVKAFLLLIFPKQTVKMFGGMVKSKMLLMFGGLVAVVIGVILGYFSFL
ncbi:hypothetical protein ACFL3C_02610 [Patescibacteria group bacterium]